MKVLHTSASFAAAIAIAASTVAPAWAFQPAPASQMQEITADVVPTQDQVQRELTDLHERLQAAEKASFYSPKAEREYLTAQRMYEFGRYDEAIEHAQIGERALPEIPNWVTPVSATR
jgi:hypothetical protein